MLLPDRVEHNSFHLAPVHLYAAVHLHLHPASLVSQQALFKGRRLLPQDQRLRNRCSLHSEPRVSHGEHPPCSSPEMSRNLADSLDTPVALPSRGLSPRQALQRRVRCLNLWIRQRAKQVDKLAAASRNFNGASKSLKARQRCLQQQLSLLLRPGRMRTARGHVSTRASVPIRVWVLRAYLVLEW